jgi:hypothetical protein
MGIKRRLLSPGLVFACIIPPMCLATSGCFINEPIIKLTTKSADRQKRAYTSRESFVIFPLQSETNWLCWRDKPDQRWPAKMMLSTGLRLAKKCGYSNLPHTYLMVFSPDSTRLAVATSKELMVANLKTRKFTRLPADRDMDKDRISSLQWLDTDELIYTYEFLKPADSELHNPEHSPSQTILLTVYRQGTNRDDRPRKVYPPKKTGRQGASESSDGRYVMTSSATGETCNMVEVKTGEVVWTDQMAGGTFQGAAWTPGSTIAAYAFCTTTKNTDDRYEAHISIIDLKTKKVRRFRRQFAKDALKPYGCGVEWTVDGKHLTVGPNRAAHLLLDIQTGSFTSLREPIIKHFKQKEETSRYTPDIHPFTKPGWLWTKGPDGNIYALDYKAKLFGFVTSADKIVLCPGAERIIEITNKHHVSVLKILELPPPDNSE